MSVIIGRAPEVQQTDYLYRQGLENSPIWEDEDGKFTKLPYRSNYRNGRYTNPPLRLVSIDEFESNFNVEEFIEEFLMKPRRDLLDRIDNFNQMYQYHIRRLELKELDINKKFGWKPGCYDTIRSLILERQGHHMKPRDMTSFSDRFERNRYSLNRLFESLRYIENSRRTAKSYCKDATIDLNKGIELFNTVMETQKSQAELANNTWNNMQITQYFANPYNDEGGNIHKTSLFTLVEMEPYTMLMQDSDLINVGTAKIRKTYCLFERNLMDLLEKQNNPNHSINIINQFGAYPSVLYRHPYINQGGAYSYDDNVRQEYINPDSIRNNVWGSLCLSDYHTDILKALENNDFILFLSQISMWSQIFNTHTTNPYNAPYKFMTDLSNRNDLLRMGWSGRSCWDNNISNLRTTLLASNQSQDEYRQYLMDEVDVHLDMNYWHKSIKAICDEKNCDYRKMCDSYNDYSPEWENNLAEENEDYLEILQQLFAQDWMGFNMDEMHQWDWWNLLNDIWGCNMNRIEGRYEFSNERHFPELYGKDLKDPIKEEATKLDQGQQEELMSAMQHWQYNS